MDEWCRAPAHLDASAARSHRPDVRRSPEVMVKVSGGARTVRGVGQHVDYIGREGKLGVETDDGERLQGEASRKRCLRTGALILMPSRRERFIRARPAARRPSLSITSCCPAGRHPAGQPSQGCPKVCARAVCPHAPVRRGASQRSGQSARSPCP